MSDAKTTPPLTPTQQIRLESVSLAYRHDRSAEDVIERASKLATWVEGNKATAKKGAKAPAAVNDEQAEPDSGLI